MTEKDELNVNHENLRTAISRLTTKYKIIRSWSGKPESIALKLSKFCIGDYGKDVDIFPLLDKYTSNSLNRKHTFIGISAADLLILLFNKDMELSINNNRLTTEYYGKTLITTCNLHGLLTKDIKEDDAYYSLL